MRRMLAVLFAAWLPIAVGGAPSRAEAPDQAAVSAPDRSAISACLQDSGDMPRACIGTIAVVCARQVPGDRREAEVDCSRREAAVWRERLEAAAMALSQRLELAPRSRFAAVQRSWEDYSTQKCAFMADLQNSARAAVMQAGCELREVAWRAIEVERLARRQAAGDTPRPRLER